MQQNLAPETVSWLDEQVRAGHFATTEAAIDYAVRLTSLRETLLSSIADPRRYGVDDVRAQLKQHFEGRRATSGGV